MIRTVLETGSTNADLAARLLAADRVAEGDWLVADRQTAGKGRQGRAWFDGHGNFMGSTVVRPGSSDPPPASLALLAGLALHEVVAPLVPPPSTVLLKWPNDLMIGSAKLAGILLERVGDAVIVGIGTNLAQAPQVEGRETIALSALGPAPDRDHFAQSLARQFDIELERWRSFGLDPLVRRWQAAAHPIGTALAVGEPGETPLEGRFAGLTADGALQLRLADGTTRTVHAGEVRLAE
ncbi:MULTISPECIES: biotin--[acetyl-CoA-carboxylase] ligase [unclassified Novosphingobium]|uniref:biotin--[acetyl-CoA-carboxylase] ligase n=1 Tax=unclassified Novosphingobium TaxID=2644732 RepID=UPI0025FC8E87|nr:MULTISPECIES: biotin--[acetyl-CoA-carboxylase] ligase [unclassified Novosphingobium]HQV02646.1 biotin--[acetyl-CoA-carboxylase] ligase [Novosphingobium sp.]